MLPSTFKYLFKRLSFRERRNTELHHPSAASLFRWPQLLGLSQAGVRASSGSPLRVRGPKFVHSLPLLSQAHWQGAQWEVGQLRHELAAIWEASVEGGVVLWFYMLYSI